MLDCWKINVARRIDLPLPGGLTESSWSSQIGTPLPKTTASSILWRPRRIKTVGLVRISGIELVTVVLLYIDTCYDMYIYVLLSLSLLLLLFTRVILNYIILFYEYNTHFYYIVLYYVSKYMCNNIVLNYIVLYHASFLNY